MRLKMTQHIMTDRITADRRRGGALPRRVRDRRGGFTLTEVLIATIILAIGLVGIGAIFPAVITQQQQAADLSAAVTAGGNAESLLLSRAQGLRTVILDPASDWDDQSQGEWVRVISTPSRRDEEGYLRMPFDLGVPNAEFDYGVGMTTSLTGLGGAAIARPTGGVVQLPYRPLREAIEGITVRVTLYEPGTSNVVAEFVLTPDPSAMPSLSQFSSSQPSRLDPGQPNSINYGSGEIVFHFNFDSDNEEVRRDSVTVDYQWLDDRLVSNPDRLYPGDNPRIAYEMLLRKGLRDQVQYCLFLYRFDVPQGFEFDPDRPSSETQFTRGMLRKERGRIEQQEQRLGSDQIVTRFYLRAQGNDLAEVMERGAWILPVNGVDPIRIRRIVRESEIKFGGEEDLFLGELDRAPVEVLANGQLRTLVGQTVEFFYMPLEVTSPDDADNIMRVRPVLAYTKQLNF